MELILNACYSSHIIIGNFGGWGALNTLTFTNLHPHFSPDPPHPSRSDTLRGQEGRGEMAAGIGSVITSGSELDAHRWVTGSNPMWAVGTLMAWAATAIIMYALATTCQLTSVA